MRRASHRPVALPLLVGLALALFVPLQASGASDLRVEQTAAPAAPCETDPAAPKRQLRAEWIATVANIDWPSARGCRPSSRGRADRLARRRGRGRSERRRAAGASHRRRVLAVAAGAWSAWLTGRQGRSPGYDPLAFAVARRTPAAWSCTPGSTPTASPRPMTSRPGADHPARVHPRRRVAYGGQLY